MSDRMIINIDESVERFGGQRDLYDELALMFIDQPQYTNAKLLELVEKGLNEQAESLVHQLKGIAGTLGAEQLFDAAKELNDVQKGKATGNISELVSKLTDTFDKTIKEFNEIYKK